MFEDQVTVLCRFGPARAEAFSPWVLRGVHWAGAVSYTHLKSSFAALEVWLILLRHPDCHGLVLRKTAASLRHSAVNQYLWAAGRLGVTDAVYRAGENAILRRGTGQMILLRGADDWTKLKSLKMPFGRVAAVHFEERDQFAGRAELDGILRTVMRGGGDFWSFETGNPPPRPGHWANAERAALVARPDYLLHHSDYRALPAAWLGSAFLAEAEQARASNEAAWRRDYLGEVGADSGLVFGNVELRDITEGEIAGFERVYRGVDWGFWPDPFAYVEAAWDLSLIHICCAGWPPRCPSAGRSGVPRPAIRRCRR